MTKPRTISDDELYEDARQIVIEAGKASTSYLQRRLKIGYARAARLVDMLEERGVVGQGEGAKARQVLIVNESSDALWKRKLTNCWEKQKKIYNKMVILKKQKF